MQVCQRALNLGNYASLKDRLFCKPHFTQVFKEKGNLSGFEEVQTQPQSVPASPAPSEAGGSGEGHIIQESPRPTPPKSRESVRRPEDFQSGFEAEYVPSTISKLGTTQCAKCKTKVFAIGKIDVDGRRAMDRPPPYVGLFGGSESMAGCRRAPPGGSCLRLRAHTPYVCLRSIECPAAHPRASKPRLARWVICCSKWQHAEVAGGSLLAPSSHHR